MYVVGTKSVPGKYPGRQERRLLAEWLEWEVAPSHSPKLVRSNHKSKARSLQRLIRHAQRVWSTIHGEKNVSKLAVFQTVLEPWRKASEAMTASRTYVVGNARGPQGFRTSPAEWGNIQATEQLFTVTRIGRLLYPEMNPYAFWRKEIKNRGLVGNARANVKRVKEFEKRLAPESSDSTTQQSQNEQGDQPIFLPARTILQARFERFKFFKIANQKRWTRAKRTDKNAETLKSLCEPIKAERILLEQLSSEDNALVLRRKCPRCSKIFWPQNSKGGQQITHCYSCRCPKREP